VTIDRSPADSHRACRFLVKFAALQECLARFAAPWIVQLDADVVLARALRTRDLATAVAGASMGMVERTCMRGSTLDRAAFRDHYRRHTLALLAPEATAPTIDDFRYLNGGVVVAPRTTWEAIVPWALQSIAAHSGDQQVGEHMVIGRRATPPSSPLRRGGSAAGCVTERSRPLCGPRQRIARPERAGQDAPRRRVPVRGAGT